ncbi:hypothetical protein [Streptomyces mangrovi]|uniref:hypothetical protein n=1 Tax=Streptomyces mangrovi TaxID=1206892 RepID=UPI00399CA701
MRSEEPVEHSIDDLLSYAQVGERVTEEDIAASRRQIEREIAATIWQGALSCESSAHTANTYLGRTPSPDRTRRRTHLGTALHAQAAQDLRAISTLVIRDTHAAQHIAWLATAGRVEPEGALVFACLLHLAHRDEAAQWWWQFSAGAGSTTSALCLYLMHMQRGELRDADHWAAQAAELERLEMTTGRPAYRPRMRLHSWEGRWSRPTWMVSRTLTELHDDTTAPGHTPPGIGLLSRSLAAAVRRLKADCDEEIGEFLRPDAELAAQLQHSHS